MTRHNKLKAVCYAAVLALGLAACGGGGGGGSGVSEDPGPTGPDPALVAAQAGATAAAEAADIAALAAEAAADGQTANMADDPASYGVARNAAMRARAAANAAQAAADAAGASTDTAAAEARRDIALAQQATAETEQGNARMYAGMVQMAYDDRIAAEKETADLATAKTDADVAAMAAEAAATKAEAAAVRVGELTGDGSEQHMTAQAAASAARMAATAAREASDLAQAATESSVAQGHQATAEAQQGTAEEEYADADELRREAQVAEDTGNVQQELRDIADAQDAAKAAAAEAMTHYQAASGKATDARTQATNARAAANRAKRARTDYANADAQATAAETAATEAEAARMRAHTANANAQDAVMAAMDADTAAAAEAAQAEAEAANLAATEEHTGTTGAGMAYMRAKDAAAKAMTYASMHVLSLLKTANAYDVTTAITGLTLDETKQREVDSIGAAITAVANVAADARAGSGTTASSTWPADTPDDPDTAEVDEFMAGSRGITVNVAGTEIVAVFKSVAADPAADPPVTAAIQTAKSIDGLDDVFIHGFDIWEDDGNPEVATDQARAIVFTNKQQGTAAVTAVTFVSAKELTNDVVTDNTVTDLGTKVGNTYTGVIYFEGTTITDPGTAFTGSLTCATGDDCSVETAENGNITVTGYTFTGSRPERAAVAQAAAAENNEYLVLGIWLDEDAGADTFGAFAVGGTDYMTTAGNVITGKATYRGSAAGAHHITGGPVSFFDGNATLEADFGADDAAGTIKGTISDIHVGGNPHGDSITLSSTALGAATFTGNAVMGPQVEPGSDMHRFNGMWSGSFYGQSEAVEDDPDTDAEEAVAAGARAPDAVAGTFGVTHSETMGTGADATTTVESFVGAFGAHK